MSCLLMSHSCLLKLVKCVRVEAAYLACCFKSGLALIYSKHRRMIPLLLSYYPGKYFLLNNSGYKFELSRLRNDLNHLSRPDQDSNLHPSGEQPHQNHSTSTRAHSITWSVHAHTSCPTTIVFQPVPVGNTCVQLPC